MTPTTTSETTTAKAPETSGQAYSLGPQVSQEYKNLFQIFGAAAGTCVADQLTAFDNSKKANAPLLVVGGTKMLVFPDGSSDPISVLFRGGDAQGSNEITAISHIGVAMGYFAQLLLQGHEIKDTLNVANITTFKSAVEAVKKANEVNDSEYWVNKLTAEANPYMFTKKTQILKMISYSCSHTLAYINRYLDGDQAYDFSYKSLHKYFYNDANETIGFNQIMVATFNLVTVDSTVYLKNLLDELSIDWEEAVIMVNGQNGGINSGLNVGTNSTFVTLNAIAGIDLSDQTLFAPYASPNFDTVMNATYDDDTVKQAAYKNLETSYRGQYFNLIARHSVANKMFDPSIELLPQIYPSWQDTPITMDVLVARMKTCMSDSNQLMSNCVVNYCSDILTAANWDTSKIMLLGLDDNWSA